MSQYERRRRGNALPGDGSRLPSGGNTRVGRRGSGHLAVSFGYLGGRLDKTGDTQLMALGDEAVGKLGVAGVYTNQRLSLSTTWEGPRLICRGFKPDPGNLAVRDYRGASGNAAMVELGTHLAIERARLVTSHLKLARLISIPTTEPRKSIDKAILGMVSESLGRNESERTGDPETF